MSDTTQIDLNQPETFKIGETYPFIGFKIFQPNGWKLAQTVTFDPVYELNHLLDIKVCPLECVAVHQVNNDDKKHVSYEFVEQTYYSEKTTYVLADDLGVAYLNACDPTSLSEYFDPIAVSHSPQRCLVSASWYLSQLYAQIYRLKKVMAEWADERRLDPDQFFALTKLTLHRDAILARITSLTSASVNSVAVFQKQLQERRFNNTTALPNFRAIFLKPGQQLASIKKIDDDKITSWVLYPTF